jgi:dipeptidyl aminopeptidase/acylaminoacyl peptidase
MNKRTLLVICLTLTITTVSGIAIGRTPPRPYPLEYWALREVINNAQVSPDGKYLALMKIPSKDGNPVIEVYDAASLSKKPFRLDADPMEITNFYWAGDEDIVFLLRQQVRNKIEGFNEGVYETRLAVVNVREKKIQTFDVTNPLITDLLRDKPGKIMISFEEGGPEGPGAKLLEADRPRSYWEFDLKKGTKKLAIRGKLSLGTINFLPDGKPSGARGFDLGKGDYVFYVRRPSDSRWTEAHRRSEHSYEEFLPVWWDEQKPSNILAVAHNGRDKRSLWSYKVDTHEFDELIYQRSDVDVYGFRLHSNRWRYPRKVVGVTYFTDKLHTEFFDEVEGATYAQLEQIIPYAHVLDINSRSADGNTMTVYNVGPRDPGTYYLLKDSKLTVVGSRQPLLESENLADLDYIAYRSRDGRKLRTYVTVPQGEPPFPLVVMPHGGPFVGEYPGYEEWAQMLANNGYMVVQPQYRGSFNYGLDFHKISFIDGGQGGYKMQDDKDDAALHLVEKGLVDPDRMAMFGWSYGGYAALVAASRTPQIYQCVIAGAAVADTLQQVNYYRYTMRGAEEEERQLAYQEGSVNPIDEVAKVNVPILLVHGDVDQRVPITHSNRYRKELDKHGKDYKYVELEGADHFSNTLFFEHQIELYESMIDFLANDCG